MTQVQRVGVAVLCALLGVAAPAVAQDVFAGLFAPEQELTVSQPQEAEPPDTKDIFDAGNLDAVLSQQERQLDDKKREEEKPTKPQHTGLAAVWDETGADFKAFPRRPSTWVILGMGAAAAALAHPIDSEANAHVVSSKTVERVFRPGRHVGSTAAQGGFAPRFRSGAGSHPDRSPDTRDEAHRPARSTDPRVLRVSIRPLRNHVRDGRGSRAASRLPGGLADAGHCDLRRGIASAR